MEQQRRFLLFMLLSLAVMIGWQAFVLPIFFPMPPRPAMDDALATEDGPVSALLPLNAFASQAFQAKPEVKQVQHPAKTVVLGSLDPTSGYFQAVQLNSRGASVDSIRLNDPRYPEFGNRQEPLTLVGHDPTVSERTFATSIPALEELFDGKSLEAIHWEVVSQDREHAVFRLLSPNGEWQVTKEYTLKAIAPQEGVGQEELRDSRSEGYQLWLKVRIQNLAAAPEKLQYRLRGPVGLPLEDPHNTYKYIDVRMGFLGEGDHVDHSSLTAANVVDQAKDNNPEIWKRPIQYLGVDTQYFAAIVHPLGNQLTTPTIESSQATLIQERQEDRFADVSVLLTSMPRTIDPGDAITDEYVLYAGPKREALLTPLRAAPILDFGWFAPVVRVMLGIVHVLHAFGLSYGLAIIGLTCLVRAAMIPLTLHQARSMDKMKELQPKIKTLHEKYKKDPSSLSADEMRQMQEVNLKMFAGCLPLLAQMPIFIALYRALQVSVDLRMAPFHIFGHWIDNLASPDALFALGFALPLVGWTEFNLLPILSILLMQINQKLTMPPPADEEQAMQYRMMNIMMYVMVVFFYRVPAGLCLYFIMSSLWGTSERLIMKRINSQKKPTDANEPIPDVPSPPVTPKPDATISDKPTLFSEIKRQFLELQEMADKEKSARREFDPNANDANRKSVKQKKNKRR